MGNLCALHTINNVLQGHVFTADDLFRIGRELDNYERSLIEPDGDTESSSQNLDSSGNFSIQVISFALALVELEIISFFSSDCRAEDARRNTCSQNAFIFHHDNHWFTVRKCGSRWFNLDSLLPYPEEMEDDGTHIFGLADAQKLNELFTGVFIVVGHLPERGTRNFVSDIGSLVLPTTYTSINGAPKRGRGAKECESETASGVVEVENASELRDEKPQKCRLKDMWREVREKIKSTFHRKITV